MASTSGQAESQSGQAESQNGHARAGQVNSDADGQYAGDRKMAASGKVATQIRLSPVNTELPVEERPIEALRLATEAFPQTGNWVAFYRVLFGESGVCRRLFPDSDQYRYFEQTDAFLEIQEMVAALRSQDTSKAEAVEPERMITIRIPKSLHDALRIEGEDLNLSINKLCISKLLQRLDSRHIPLQKGRRRGRRPGPQKRSQPVASDAQSTASGNATPTKVSMTRVKKSAAARSPGDGAGSPSGDWA